MTQPSVEPRPRATVDRLADSGETRGARSFTKPDLTMAYVQFRIREEDR